MRKHPKFLISFKRYHKEFQMNLKPHSSQNLWLPLNWVERGALQKIFKIWGFALFREDIGLHIARKAHMRNTVLSLSPFGCSLLSLTTTTKAASERQSRNRTSVIFFCKVPYTLMTYYKLLLLIWGAILWIQLIIMIMYINPTTTEQGSSSRSN